MPIPINCPGCQKLLRVPDEFSGKRIRCPKCGERIPVPVLVQTPAPSLEIDLSEDPPPASPPVTPQRKTGGQSVTPMERNRFGLTEGIAQLFTAAWIFIVFGAVIGSFFAENGWLFFAAVGGGASTFFIAFGYLVLVAILRNLQAIRQAVEEIAENRTS